MLLPDGRTQVVKYYVTGDEGYVAEVTYEGTATVGPGAGGVGGGVGGGSGGGSVGGGNTGGGGGGLNTGYGAPNYN